jgi:GAF domain-containing protein
MATPLTVCLVVIGRHVPRLSFLSVLLSDEEPLTPAEDCYHRLLTASELDEMELIETFLKTNSLTTLYDTVFIPVITAAETDARHETLDPLQLAELKQRLRDILEDLATRSLIPPHSVDSGQNTAEVPAPLLGVGRRVCCLPARAERDELANVMLTQLLRHEAFEVVNAAAQSDVSVLLDLVEKNDPDVVCISVVSPSTVIHGRYLCMKVRAQFPQLKIIVGLWGATDKVSETSTRLHESGANEVVVSLSQAVVEIANLAPSFDEPMTPAPIPADEEDRLAALAETKLLNAETELLFDRITAKLARIFEVPVALLNLVDRDRQFFKSHTGLPADLAKARHTSRDVSVCGHVVASNEMLVVEDLARDRRFANNPMLKQTGLRFYAGAPVHAPNGQPIGSLCILDVKPRQLTLREKRLLLEYANEVSEEISQRAATAPAAAAAA